MLLLRNWSTSVRVTFLRGQHTQVYQCENVKTYKEIPGPSLFKLFTQSLPSGQYYKLPISDVMKKFRDEYGPIVKIPGAFGRRESVIVFSADDIEKTYRAEGKRPIRRALESLEYFRTNYRRDIFKDTPGLPTSQGDQWYNFRSKVNAPMMQPKITKLYVPKIDEVAQDFVKKVRQIRNSKDEVPDDFYENLNDFGLESIAVIGLDKRLGVIDDPNSSKLNQLVKNMFISIYELDFEPSIWRYFKTPAFKKAMRNHEELIEILNNLVTEAIHKRKESELIGDNEGVLDKLLKIDKNVAIVMVQDMLLGGIDSTAVTAAIILYSLAKNPEKQENLRQEIFELLPEKSSKLTPSSLGNIPYLRACIKEAMRLHPPTPGNVRALSQDLVLRGYNIPKDTDVIMSNITSTDEKYFKQSKEFIPERWLKDNTDPGCPHATHSHTYANLPFGHGTRMCVGRRLAEVELQVLIARILREFTLEWHHPELKFKCSIFNAPADPLRFKFSDLK